jgi:hypothetical protein
LKVFLSVSLASPQYKNRLSESLWHVTEAFDAPASEEDS